MIDPKRPLNIEIAIYSELIKMDIRAFYRFPSLIKNKFDVKCYGKVCYLIMNTKIKPTRPNCLSFVESKKES